jgi:hypothetical protein
MDERFIRPRSMRVIELPSNMVVVVAPEAAHYLLGRLRPGLPLVALCPTGTAGFWGIFQNPRRPCLIPPEHP